MKIACVILGTRGDVQPMVALATGLIKKGHEVIICAPSENEQLARAYNCQFVAFPFMGDQFENRKIKITVRYSVGRFSAHLAIGDDFPEKIIPSVIPMVICGTEKFRPVIQNPKIIYL